MTLTYYLQSCPTCGRHLQIRIEYMGRRVICYHCSASFIAQEPELEPAETLPEETLSQKHENSPVRDRKYKFETAFRS